MISSEPKKSFRADSFQFLESQTKLWNGKKIALVVGGAAVGGLALYALSKLNQETSVPLKENVAAVFEPIQEVIQSSNSSFPSSSLLPKPKILDLVHPLPVNRIIPQEPLSSNTSLVQGLERFISQGKNVLLQSGAAILTLLFVKFKVGMERPL